MAELRDGVDGPSGSVPLHAEEQIGEGWTLNIFTDEVFWKFYKDGEFAGYHNVAKFPTVPGYFLCKVIEDVYGEVHYPVSGPYPSQKAAKAAALVLGPCPEHDED